MKHPAQPLQISPMPLSHSDSPQQIFTLRPQAFGPGAQLAIPVVDLSVIDMLQQGLLTLGQTTLDWMGLLLYIWQGIRPLGAC